MLLYNIKVTWRVRFIWIWFDEKSQIKNSNGSDDRCCAPYRSDGGRHWRVWDQWGLRQPGDLTHRLFLKKTKKPTNRRFTLLMWGECLFVFSPSHLPLLFRRCTAWRSWGSHWRRWTPTAAPSPWVTRWAAPAPARWWRCSTSSGAEARGQWPRPTPLPVWLRASTRPSGSNMVAHSFISMELLARWIAS